MWSPSIPVSMTHTLVYFQNVYISPVALDYKLKGNRAKCCVLHNHINPAGADITKFIMASQK